MSKVYLTPYATSIHAEGDISSGSDSTATMNITENGLYNVTNYALANVNVAGGSEGDSFTKVIPWVYPQEIETVMDDHEGIANNNIHNVSGFMPAYINVTFDGTKYTEIEGQLYTPETDIDPYMIYGDKPELFVDDEEVIWNEDLPFCIEYYPGAGKITIFTSTAGTHTISIEIVAEITTAKCKIINNTGGVNINIGTNLSDVFGYESGGPVVHARHGETKEFDILIRNTSPYESIWFDLVDDSEELYEDYSRVQFEITKGKLDPDNEGCFLINGDSVITMTDGIGEE